MSRRVVTWTSVGVLVIVLLLAYFSVFVVNQTQQALVLRFGNPVQVISSPGLFAKIPLVDDVVYVDKRLIDLDSPPPSLEVITSDQKRLTVDTFGRYRITDPLKYYQALGNTQLAQQTLTGLLNSAVRRVVGDASFTDLVRDHRADLMASITQQINAATAGFGVDVVDVRIRSADLPAANSEAIYQRMQTERQLVAAQTRAQGTQAGLQIRAEADREVTVITAEANGQASALRGDGDAQRNQILSQAFSQDPEFFAFYRALQAYQTSFSSNDTRLVLSPNSDFFKFFNDPAGGAANPDAAAIAAGPGPGVPLETVTPPSATTPSPDDAVTTLPDLPDLAVPPSPPAPELALPPATSPTPVPAAPGAVVPAPSGG